MSPSNSYDQVLVLVPRESFVANGSGDEGKRSFSWNCHVGGAERDGALRIVSLKISLRHCA
jgi:hypothetical protein